MDSYQERKISTGDGFQLTARFFSPQSTPRGTVLIAPAMGVAQTFYGDFATWLASQGYLAVTFDYRGIGLSRPGSLRGFKADIMVWAQQDCGAVLETVLAEQPRTPLYWIGHSLGGQILPFVPQHERITKMITVATGSGYWRENAPSLRRMVWWVWYVLVPITLPLFGYFPGKRLRKIGDLPRGVMAQWRKWCLHHEYAMAEGEHIRARYAAVEKPITSFSFEDDQYMSRRNTYSIHGFYTKAALRLRRFSSQDTGGQTIGHFGFFRPKFKESLWQGHLLAEL